MARWEVETGELDGNLRPSYASILRQTRRLLQQG